MREVRNNHRLLVEVQGRALVMNDADVTALDAGSPRSRGKRTRAETGPGASGPGPAAASTRRPGFSGATEIDLHGLTVEEALARFDSALNEALLADAESLRLIHGRSGGKIRAALHRRLREMPSVRSFRLDPGNDGVTIVSL